MLAQLLSHRPELYRALLDSMTEGVSLADRDGLIVYTNPAEDRLFGYASGELVGQHVSVQNAYPDAENQRRVSEVIDHLEHHGSWEGEWRNRRKDGSEFVTASRITAVAVDGRDYWLCVQRDVTHDRELQSVLAQSEERLELAALAAGIGVWDWDLATNRFHYTDRAKAIFGFSPDHEVTYEDLRRITHPEDWPNTTAQSVRARDPEIRDQASYEYRVVLPHGERWVLAHGRAVFDDGPNGIEAKRYVGTLQDITERKGAERQLIEEQRLLETVNKTGALIASELDLERVVQIVTDAGVSLTGAQFGAFFYNVEDQAGGKMMLYTLSGAERSHFEKFGMPRPTAVFQPTFKGEGVIRSADILADERYGKNAPHQGMPKGHLPVRSYLAVPVVSRTGENIGGLFFGHPEPDRFADRHERLMVGIAGQAATAIDNARLFQAAQRELSERRAAEESLRQLNETLEHRVEQEVTERLRAEEALRHAQKLDAMGQLTGGVAHDFNNLLSPIIGGLDMLLRRGITDARTQRIIEAALASADRAKTLVQRLLAFARRQPLQPSAVDVGAIIVGMRDLLSSTLGPRVLLRMVLADGVPPATADANQLEMALLNLAVNARDAMADGGELTITTNSVPAQEGEPANSFVQITVRDSGTGMDEETRKRAIEPFFSTKGIGRGTGLGLSMVHGLTAQLGGHMEIDSSPGFGTTVSIYLPVADAPALPNEAASARQNPLHSGLALLVDDEDLVRGNTAEMLRELGFQVLEAASGGAALRLASDHKVDLLVTDHLMPGMVGTEVARALRERQPNVTALIISGYADIHGIPMEFHRLTKPFRESELADAIRHAMQHLR